jgi:hypothetical protein
MVKELVRAGGPKKSAAVGEVKERADAEVVARAEQGAILGVPDYVGKVAEDVARRFLAPPLVGAEDQFAVRVGSPGTSEFGQEFLTVIDTTIERDGKAGGRRIRGRDPARNAGFGPETPVA